LPGPGFSRNQGSKKREKIRTSNTNDTYYKRAGPYAPNPMLLCGIGLEEKSRIIELGRTDFSLLR
jgi:hypothetical protein